MKYFPIPKKDNQEHHWFLNRLKNLKTPGCIVAHSAIEAIEKAKEFEQEEVFIIGGAQIYKLFIEKADKLYI